MSLPENKSERGVRSPVTPLEVHGSLRTNNDVNAEPLLLWNVSDEGLCLWVTTRLKPKSRIEVSIDRPFVIELIGEVRWCRTIPEKSGYLVGIKINENSDLLAQMHAQLVAPKKLNKAG